MFSKMGNDREHLYDDMRKFIHVEGGGSEIVGEKALPYEQSPQGKK